MKSLFTSLIVIFACFHAHAQESADYYRKTYARPIGAKPYSTESLLKKFGDVRIMNRWYAGVDGFLRTDKNTISNNFDGLISTESPTVSSWSVVAGWIYHEQWSVEMEYAHSPIHNVLLINGDNPLKYVMQNEKNSVIVRGKMRLLFGKSTFRRSAFWIGAGAGIVPNSGQQRDYMEFSGYRERGRRQGIDTLFLSSTTRINSSMTGLAEASAEYVIKVAKSVDLSLFARKQWGFGNSITTDLVYTVNKADMQQSKIEGDGSGWNFGISLRYVFHIGYDFSSLGHVGGKI
jgi:hypothetical protein